MNTQPTATKRPGLALGSILSLLSLLSFAFFVYSNFRTIEVSGDSMLPTFTSGQKLLATRAYWLVGNIKPNDIVVVASDEPGETIIKRVYRVEGGTVDWLNIPENYSMANGEFKVPKDSLYLLGDNREVSEDSRKFGPVPIEKVLGKIVLKKWF